MSKGKKVHELMTVLINKYFEKHLSLSTDDADLLHQKYYKDYGLAISGLVVHHKVDPLEFNREVDDALPLDGLITPNPDLRRLLEDIDTSKVKPWLFTNAYITHGQRVVKLLGIEDLFEDDSHLNCRHAQARGWTTAHLLEPDRPEPPEKASKYQIRDLESLRSIFPHFFRSSSANLADESMSSQSMAV
ncbi:MAG: hypothetical protein Q9223_004584 [Gallowayella weberi]